jgi:dolichol-phosphate mannosyltransferase
MNVETTTAKTTASLRKQPLISLVLPVFNEIEILDTLRSCLDQSMCSVGVDWEIVFVNDGSTDGSGRVLSHFARTYPHIKAIHLSRNFGHQAAIHAGLSHCAGDAAIIMDSDMQDDPTRLSKFIDAWREGYDVVYAVREKRKEAWWKNFLFLSFYRLLNQIADIRIPQDAGAFSLLDRRAIDEVLRLKEVERFFPGLRSWIGFQQKGVVIERCARHDDKPRVSLWQLFRLAQSAIFGFSRFPLFIFYAISIASLTVSLSCLTYALISKWCTGLAIPGWASTTTLASFFGGLNALGIAVLGEYVIRIHHQVLGRPTFVVDQVISFVKAPNSSSDSISATDSVIDDSYSDTFVSEYLNELRKDISEAIHPSKTSSNSVVNSEEHSASIPKNARLQGADPTESITSQSETQPVKREPMFTEVYW